MNDGRTVGRSEKGLGHTYHHIVNIQKGEENLDCGMMPRIVARAS